MRGAIANARRTLHARWRKFTELFERIREDNKATRRLTRLPWGLDRMSPAHGEKF